jgi:hypothetical protein
MNTTTFKEVLLDMVTAKIRSGVKDRLTKKLGSIWFIFTCDNAYLSQVPREAGFDWKPRWGKAGVWATTNPTNAVKVSNYATLALLEELAHYIVGATETDKDITVVQQSVVPQPANIYFESVHRNNKTHIAHMEKCNGGLWLLHGSEGTLGVTNHFTQKSPGSKIRDELIAKGVLAQVKHKLVLTQKVKVTSESAAYGIMFGSVDNSSSVFNQKVG